MTPRLRLPLFLIAALVIGAWLRLDQITAQVLLDDEWHLVHQITYYPPTRIASTFGAADYSIPLALFNWEWMHWLGVSELSLRMPMLVAGLLTVVILPLGLRDKIGERTIALFALLLALSPFLVSYSRIARSYALTLPAIYVAYWLFERVNNGNVIRWKPRSATAFCAGSSYGHILLPVPWWWRPSSRRHGPTGAAVGTNGVPCMRRRWWPESRSRWRCSATVEGFGGAGRQGRSRQNHAGHGRWRTFPVVRHRLASDGLTVCVVLAAIGWKSIWRATPLCAGQRWASR